MNMSGRFASLLLLRRFCESTTIILIDGERALTFTKGMICIDDGHAYYERREDLSLFLLPHIFGD